MKKIPSLFQRNYETDRLVRAELVPGTEWVAEGLGTPTEKIDGTCCRVEGGELYKRYELKRGRQLPRRFMSAQEADPVTGDIPGWVPVGDGPDDQWHREAWANFKAYHQSIQGITLPDWTYELVGPKIQGNPYDLPNHLIYRHGGMVLPLRLTGTVEDMFAGIRAFLSDAEIEGIVWWRDPHDVDSPKVKIKRRDFGLTWPVK